MDHPYGIMGHSIFPEFRRAKTHRYKMDHPYGIMGHPIFSIFRRVKTHRYKIGHPYGIMGHSIFPEFRQVKTHRYKMDHPYGIINPKNPVGMIHFVAPGFNRGSRKKPGHTETVLTVFDILKNR